MSLADVAVFRGLRSLLLLAGAFQLGCAGLLSRSPAAPPSAMAQPVVGSLPIDPLLKEGRLENGFTYSLRRQPAGPRAQVWLVVKTDGASPGGGRGELVHLLQHLAFAGTPSFDGPKIADLLGRAGLAAGADANTSHTADAALFKLALPAQDRALLKESLALLREWASPPTFAAADLEKERTAIKSEGGAAPTGTQDAGASLDQVDEATLRRTFAAWLRPERMALIVVGDVDVPALEQTVRATFGQLATTSALAASPEIVLPSLGRTSFITAPAPADGPSTLSLGFKRLHPPLRTEQDLREEVVEQLYAELVNARLVARAARPSSPLLEATWQRRPGLSRELSLGRAIAKPGRHTKALEAFWAELRQAEREGFTAEELGRAKAALRESDARDLRESSTSGEARRADGLVAHFVYGDIALDVEDRRAREARLASEIALAEVNAFAKTLSQRAERVVRLTAPKDKLPDEGQLRALVARVDEAPEKFRGAHDKLLVDEPPTPGAIVREELIGELNVTRWTLSNGATVLVKPTTYAKDELLVQAFGPGGTSLATDRDYLAATVAAEVVAREGLGTHDAKELAELLTGSNAEIHPWISELEQGIRGSSSPRDLEVLLQLLHLGFTAPRTEPAAFEAFKERWQTELSRPDPDATRAFAEAQLHGTFGNHLRRRTPTIDAIKQLSLDTALDFYRQSFAEAGTFTFVFVGDLDKAELKPLVEEYLASLPSSGKKRQWKDVGARRPAGLKLMRVERGIRETSSIMMTFHGESKWSLSSETALFALRDLLDLRVRDVLATTSPKGAKGEPPSLMASFERRPLEQHALSIAFQSAPLKTNETKRALLTAIAALKLGTITDTEVAAIRDKERSRWEAQSQTNAFWLDALAEQSRFGGSPRELLERGTAFEAIDAAALRLAAQRYLNPKRHIEAVLWPTLTAAFAPAPSKAKPEKVKRRTRRRHASKR